MTWQSTFLKRLFIISVLSILCFWAVQPLNAYSPPAIVAPEPAIGLSSGAWVLPERLVVFTPSADQLPEDVSGTIAGQYAWSATRTADAPLPSTSRELALYKVTISPTPTAAHLVLLYTHLPAKVNAALHDASERPLESTCTDHSYLMGSPNWNGYGGTGMQPLGQVSVEIDANTHATLESVLQLIPKYQGAREIVYVLDTAGLAAEASVLYGDLVPPELVQLSADPSLPIVIHHSDLVSHQVQLVAPSADTRAIQVLNANGFGTSEELLLTLAMLGSSEIKPGVINMSFGTPFMRRCTLQTLNELVVAAASAEHLLVAASGNDNLEAPQSCNDGKYVPTQACPHYPARLKGVLAVGAIDTNGQVANYARQGDVVAIGGDQTSLIAHIHNGTNWEGYAITGTSFASPQVSGLLATMRGMNGDPLARLLCGATSNGLVSERDSFDCQ